MSKEVEYPRWVYPPDGGPGRIVQTPDERPDGWLDGPKEPGPAAGERVIGQPEHPTGMGTPAPDVAQAAPAAPPVEEGDETARKSKKK